MDSDTSGLLDIAAEGIFGVDTDGRITFVNSSVSRILGFTSEELIGQLSHSLFHHHHADGRDYPVEDCPMFAAYARGEASSVDDEHLWRKDLNVQQAFEAYLQENPDYAEKFQELVEDTASPAENAAFLEMARKLEAQRKQKELEEKLESKMSKFCPDCARVLGTKKQCKCGYRRK